MVHPPGPGRAIVHRQVGDQIMNVTELTIGLLTYYVGTDSIVALLTDQRGQTKRFRLPNCRDVFPLIDHFVAVLEQPVAYTPTELAAAFREFVHGWGRQLLPPAGDLDPFDVLVIVPHPRPAPAHRLPTRRDQPGRQVRRHVLF